MLNYDVFVPNMAMWLGMHTFPCVSGDKKIVKLAQYIAIQSMVIPALWGYKTSEIVRDLTEWAKNISCKCFDIKVYNRPIIKIYVHFFSNTPANRQNYCLGYNAYLDSRIDYWIKFYMA